MQTALSPRDAARDVAVVEPIPLRRLAPWTLFGAALAGAAYLVGFAPDALLHEVTHDARHLLGFPCH